MKSNPIRRLAALLCMMLVMVVVLNAALAEAVEPEAAPDPAAFEETPVVSAADEDPVEELGDVSLDEAGAPEAPAPDDWNANDAGTEAAGPEGVGETVPGWADRRFARTESAGAETWQAVNLLRSEGFGGKLAKVTGNLTLNNVRIEGQSAGSVNLLDYFDLAPRASITVADPASY